MNKLNRLLLVPALVSMLGVAFAEKALKIGVEGAYPPFNEIDKDGHLIGFDVDIAKALCVQMQRHCQLVQVDWDGLIPALKARKIDAISASMSATAERQKIIDFTDRIYKIPVRLVRRKGSNIVYGEQGMKGKVIGVQVSTTFAKHMTAAFSSVATIKTYSTTQEALLDLQAGRVDTVAAESLVLSDFLKKPQGQNFEFFGPKLIDEKYYGKGIAIGIRKNSAKLKTAFNKAIKAIRANGVYKTINDKYFSFDVYGE